MGFRPAVALFVAILLATPSAEGMAQGPRDTASVWRAAAGRLVPGDLVRVLLAHGKPVRGHVVRVGLDDIWVLPKTRQPVAIRALRFTDITSIERQAEGWSPGAKILTTVGIVMLAELVAVAILLGGSNY